MQFLNAVQLIAQDHGPAGADVALLWNMTLRDQEFGLFEYEYEAREHDAGTEQEVNRLFDDPKEDFDFCFRILIVKWMTGHAWLEADRAEFARITLDILNGIRAKARTLLSETNFLMLEVAITESVAGFRSAFERLREQNKEVSSSED